jgi:hypothetical protein
MIINFQTTAKIVKPNLLKDWYDSSDGTVRVISINEATEYNGARSKADEAKARKKLNDSIINNYKLSK